MCVRRTVSDSEGRDVPASSTLSQWAAGTQAGDLGPPLGLEESGKD